MRLVGSSRAARYSIVYAGVVLLLLVYAFPLYWTSITSLKSLKEMSEVPVTLWPKQVTFDHYRDIFLETYFVSYVRNSLTVGLGTTLLTVFLGLLTAFALSRLRFFGKGLLSGSILTVYLFPGILLVTPLYFMMVGAGLYNTLTSLVVVDVLYSLPFAVFTLRAFIDDVPRELEESARIDGASWMRTLVHIYLPLVLPGLATAAIYAFVVSWNEYLFASVLVSRQTTLTLPVGIAGWASSYTINWGQISAASVISLVPTIFFFAAVGRFFVRGLTAGAVRG